MTLIVRLCLDDNIYITADDQINNEVGAPGRSAKTGKKLIRNKTFKSSKQNLIGAISGFLSTGKEEGFDLITETELFFESSDSQPLEKLIVEYLNFLKAIQNTDYLNENNVSIISQYWNHQYFHYTIKRRENYYEVFKELKTNINLLNLDLLLRLSSKWGVTTSTVNFEKYQFQKLLEFNVNYFESGNMSNDKTPELYYTLIYFCAEHSKEISEGLLKQNVSMDIVRKLFKDFRKLIHFSFSEKVISRQPFPMFAYSLGKFNHIINLKGNSITYVGKT